MSEQLDKQLGIASRSAYWMASALVQANATTFSLPIKVRGVEVLVSATLGSALPSGNLPLAEEKALIEALLFDIHCEEVDRTPMEEMPESLIDSSLRRREQVALAVRGGCMALRLPGY